MEGVEPIRDEDVQTVVRSLLEQQDFPGRSELLAQVDGLEYVDGPVTMMRLRVDRSYPSAQAESPAGNRPTVLGDAGDPIGGLLLWLDSEGYIDCLEYYWFQGAPPRMLPRPHQLVEGP